MSIRRLAAAVRRHRTLVRAVAAVTLVVTVPRLASSSPSTTIANAGAAGARPEASATREATTAGESGAGGAATDRGGAGSSASSAGDAAGPVDIAAYPGVGTPDALANPMCDPATGRIRFPSLYAPECVRPWPLGSDNGGATAQGVTADSIKILILVPPPNPASTVSPDVIKQQTSETLHAFADHYELWGRKLDVVFHTLSGTDEASQRADAIEVANDVKPFLASSYLFIGGDTPRVWSTELAARGIISWDESVTFVESQAQAGYRWAYSPDDRLDALELGEYVGKRLAGRTARFAGDANLAAQQRSFGLAYEDAWDRSTFEQAFRQYGGSLTDAVSYSAFTDTATLQQQASTQIARLKARGVNNVIVVGGALYSGLLTRAATQQSYFPEWTMSGWKLQDVAVLSRIAMDQQQWGHAFGIGLVPPLESPVSISERSLIYQWAYGHVPADDATNGQIYLLAKDVMAGLMLAGPDLTPATFRNALFDMKPAGGRWCGCATHNGVSFGRHISTYPGDKYFDTDDYTEKWWDPVTSGQDEVGIDAKGVYQVVNGGQRYSPGDWPITEPDVFDPSSSVVGYSTEPPNDVVPSYPPPPR